jgi:hypothetical protein
MPLFIINNMPVDYTENTGFKPINYALEQRKLNQVKSP